ncbi:MAG: hypothetical protein IJR47_04720 [Clostridia bacterium]|nr:hypothetical protein [Clostridia bacterium]
MSISSDSYNAYTRDSIINANSNSNAYILNNKKKTTEDIIGSSMFSTDKRNVTNELGQDAFWNILVAQLQNQDPMSPMDDRDFIAQMAQFSSLEQMKQLNETFQSSQSYNYIGKTIISSSNIQDEVTGEWVKTEIGGVVSGVQMYNNKPYLIVGDYLLEPSSVKEVYNSNNLDTGILQGGALIGKNITAQKMNGTSMAEISGIVQKVLVKEGRVFALLDNGEEVAVANITSINGENSNQTAKDGTENA